MSDKIKLSQVKKLVDAPPRERAAAMLQLGAALERTKRRPARPSALPPPVRRESVEGAPPGALIERLHGIAGAAPQRVTGLRETGRKLKTAAGRVADLVLTPVGRKRVARRAMKSERDRSVADVAVRQLALALCESAPLPRVCAAYAYWQATGLSEASVPVLRAAIESDDTEERLVAATALKRITGRRVAALEGTRADDRPHSPVQPERASMTVVIHGTFAKDEPWYRPGGDFHDYLKAEVYPDTYSGDDYFFWSGRYAASDAGLKTIWREAATKLVSWCASRPARTLRLIAHSHGINVVNMATQMGLKSCTLIQLSPPIRDWNLPDIGAVSSATVFNIHSRFDPVVYIDGGLKTYRGTAVEPHERIKIIARFGHSDSHEAKLWRRRDVPALVRSVCP